MAYFAAKGQNAAREGEIKQTIELIENYKKLIGAANEEKQEILQNTKSLEEQVVSSLLSQLQFKAVFDQFTEECGDPAEH